jgi:hypothetical protein
MANNIGSPDSGWHLLAELVLEAGPNSIQQAAELVAETLQELGLQDSVVERIQKVAIEALRGMVENEKLVQQRSPIRIRILVSDASYAKEADAQSGHNWGFFLLEKQCNCPPASYHRLELLLYQETE